MKKYIYGALALSLVALCALPVPSYAEAPIASTQAPTPMATAPIIAPIVPTMMQDIAILQKKWAEIKYQTPQEKQQSHNLEILTGQAEKIMQKYPQMPEPKIWLGIILSTKAGVDGGLGALKHVKMAKKLFEQALTEDPNALSGSAYTSLGSLYYQVPGWPIGFGDKKKAEKYLRQALKINPNGIDPNFFYADFLIENGRGTEATAYLMTALKAPDRANRPLADAGRRQEIKALLAKINKNTDNQHQIRNQ